MWSQCVTLLTLTVVFAEQDGGSEKRRPCGRADKKKFNENLLNLFRAEYGKELTADSDTTRILNWKFDSLDRNDDKYLQQPEYKPLKRLKRLVKPKKCAKTFARACDRDKDARISREEWSSCMGVDIKMLRSSEIVSLSEHRKRKDEPEVNDCMSDRQTVLSEQRDSGLYVPECAPDGRYRRVQCYRSTGYCWCVREDDGEPIPGTSVKDEEPDCDSLPVPVRPMKGCPYDKREAFLLDLASYLGTNSSEGSLAALTFANFDKNANKFLDKKEWKAFRTLVASQTNLRRCGKRLPRFCDVNNDRRISLTEWSNCVGGGDGKRRGPNPLQSILKDD